LLRPVNTAAAAGMQATARMVAASMAKIHTINTVVKLLKILRNNINWDASKSMDTSNSRHQQQWGSNQNGKTPATIRTPNLEACNSRNAGSSAGTPTTSICVN